MKECEENEFECHPGKCIPDTWKCDNEEDCENGVDELPDECSK